MELEERWKGAWFNLGSGRPEPRVLAELLGRYSEPHRAYHNVEHLNDCFRRFDEVHGLARYPAEVLLARGKVAVNSGPAFGPGGAGHVRLNFATAPQVLTDVDHSMSVMRDESFGPTVGIMKVKGDEEAIRLMNDSPYGLSAAIWTSDVDAAEAIGEKLETGTVFMNRCDYLDPALAWTGVKDTGRGASLSRLAYESLTRPKSYHLRQI